MALLAKLSLACELPKADQKIFDQRLSEAESSFLNMNAALCAEQLDEMWTDVLPQYLGERLRGNLLKICRLGLMNEVGLQDTPEDSESNEGNWMPRCHGLLSLESESALPSKVQEQIKNIRRKLKKSPKPTVLDDLKSEKVWIDGETVSEAKFQTPASYFVQHLDTKICNLQSFELRAMENSPWEKILISETTLLASKKPIFENAKPIRSSAFNAIDQPAKSSPNEIENPKSVISTYDPKDFEALSLEAEDSEAGIFSSPWFWLGAGVVAGGAGYLIYDGTQGKTVRTP